MKKYIGLTKKVLWCVLGINIVCFLLALLHYYSNKGGLTPGTYNTITFEKYLD